MNSVEHSSSNCLPPLTNLPVNQDTTVEELDPFAVGASEEVNTTTASDDRNAFEKDVTEEIETTVSESVGVKVTSLLNTPYKSTETNMAVDKCKGRGLLSVKVYDSPNNSENATDKSIESGTDCNINVTDTDASLTTVLVSEGVSLDPTQGSYVVHVVEQVAIDHINQYFSASQADERSGNTVLLQEQSDRHQFIGSSKSLDTSPEEESKRSFHDVSTVSSGKVGYEDSDLEDIDTRQIAEALTNELKKYSIPQAVFARKILNRSQGTLSDVLRKPKPWNEMKGGRDIFRKMKEWLDLPEVKRIPQLRAEAALELDSKAKKEETNRPPAKRARLHFTDSQKRALFAIFKETKKPSREMQIALAEELGLERGTVANFFMNARRRHPEI